MHDLLYQEKHKHRNTTARLDAHIPQEHVDYRYPLSQSDLRVIASRDEDRYNNEVRPRTLPLRDGICILREPLLNDPDGAAGLNWYNPPSAPPADDQRIPLPAPPKPEGKMCKTSPTLDCQLCRNPGCTMILWQRGHGGHNVHRKSHGDPIPNATANKPL